MTQVDIFFSPYYESINKNKLLVNNAFVLRKFHLHESQLPTTTQKKHGTTQIRSCLFGQYEMLFFFFSEFFIQPITRCSNRGKQAMVSMTIIADRENKKFVLFLQEKVPLEIPYYIHELLSIPSNQPSRLPEIVKQKLVNGQKRKFF